MFVIQYSVLTLLQQATFISLSIIGLYSAMQEGMVLAFIPYLLASLPRLMRKPLFECLICMSSFWSVVIWFTTGNPLSWHLIFIIPAVAGLNTLADAFLGFIRDYKWK